jgi:3-oxoacyl-[acyl-carrier protein] reductase
MRPMPGTDGVAKLSGALRRREDTAPVTVIKAFTTAQLDLALGRSNVVHAALLAGPANDTFLARYARLERFRAGARPQAVLAANRKAVLPRTELTGFENGMSDTKTPDGKTLSVKPTLSLKRGAEAGVVRQSFSHGRSKQVVVEVKKRRTVGADGKPEAAAPAPAPVAKRAAPAAPAAKTTPAAATPAVAPAPAAAAPKPSGVVLRTLTDEERNRRAHALGDARLREAEERKIAEEEAKIRQQRDAIEKTEREAAEARKREEDERRKHDEVTKKKADEVAKKRFGEGETAARPGARPVVEAEEDEAPKFRRGPGGAMRPAAPPQRPTRAAKTATERPRGRLTLVTAMSADEVRERSEASFRRRVQRRTSEKEQRAEGKAGP